MPSELYVQIPATYGDPLHAPPGSPTDAVLGYGSFAAGYLLNLHLQLVLYSKRWRLKGLIHESVICKYVRPASPRAAKRHAERLVQSGFIEPRGDRCYYVPAAEEWPVVRIGTRDAIPDRVRVQVHERDGWRCTECGTDEKLTVDHIVPWSQNGPDDDENLRTLCGPCNSRKGARV